MDGYKNVGSWNYLECVCGVMCTADTYKLQSRPHIA